MKVLYILPPDTATHRNTPQPRNMIEQEQEREQQEIQLQALRTELTAAKQKVMQLQQQIKEVEEDIYSKCQHEWKIDYTNVGEHTEYICTKCAGVPRGFHPPTTVVELHT